MSSDAQPPRSSTMLRRLGIGSLVLLVVVMTAWAALAIYYSNLPSGWLRGGAAALFIGGTVGIFCKVVDRRRALLVFSGTFVVIWIWWIRIPASHDRDWAVDVARLPYASIEGDEVRVHEVRNFTYRSDTDFDVAYETRTYDLRTIESMELVMSYWDGNRDIAHTMLSFGFADGRWLVLSIETRREKGESYSTVAGFFKQFELIYVLADERDALRVRAMVRDEDLYIYPFKSTRAQNRVVLTNLVEMVNDLKAHPVWYNALEYNCTTAMIPLGKGLTDKAEWDIRRIFNGHVDEYEYERGNLPSVASDGEPFEQMRAKHRVTDAIREFAGDQDFSNKIRSHLPKRTR